MLAARAWVLVLLCLGCASLWADPVATALESMMHAKAAGDPELAYSLAAEARAALPESELLSDRALFILGEQGRLAVEREVWPEAEQHFAELAARIEGARGSTHPTLGYALRELAKVQALQGATDGARTLWERVVSLEHAGQRAADEDRAFAFAGLARLAAEEGKPAEADRLFREAISQGSTTSQTFWEMRADYAALLRSLDREDEAERVEAGIGAPRSRSHYLWYVLRGRFGLDPFDERVARRWPDARMPLRIYLPPPPAGSFAGIEPGAVLEIVRHAVLGWQDVVRPGVPSFVFVPAARKADVRFEWVEKLPGGNIGFTRSYESIGSIQLAWRWDARVAAPLDALAAVARHELGHALGLHGHSPEASDLMSEYYFRPGHEPVRELTARDRETLRRLYAFEPGATVSRYDAR